MKKPFDYVNHLGAVKTEEAIYLPLNNKIILYSQNFEKLSEIVNEDEILNFHLLNNEILIIGKVNKKIILMNTKGEKVDE